MHIQITDYAGVRIFRVSNVHTGSGSTIGTVHTWTLYTGVHISQLSGLTGSTVHLFTIMKQFENPTKWTCSSFYTK